MSRGPASPLRQTVSLMPRSTSRIGACWGPDGVCSSAAAAHAPATASNVDQQTRVATAPRWRDGGSPAALNGGAVVPLAHGAPQGLLGGGGQGEPRSFPLLLPSLRHSDWTSEGRCLPGDGSPLPLPLTCIPNLCPQTLYPSFGNEYSIVVWSGTQ